MKSPLKGLERKWGFFKTQDGLRQAPMLAAIRLISWLVRCSLRKATIIDLRRWNVRMFLPPNWRGFAKRAFAFRENYEPELIYMERLLSPGSVFIDVGANMGIYTLVASKLVGEGGRVMAFEPSAQSFPILRQNIALNSLTNVCALPVALSDSAGKAWLYHPGLPEGNSLGRDPAWGNDAEEVSTETLDHIVEEASVKQVDVIKIDVEGAEELVMRGATKILTSMHPAIIFEVNPSYSALLGLSAQGASKLLQSLGYEILGLSRLAVSDAARAQTKYHYNCVAIYRHDNKRAVSGMSACSVVADGHANRRNC
jgi:FkbM family methyltransferase